MMSAKVCKVKNICYCLSILTDDIKIAGSNDASREHKNIKEAFTNELKRNVHCTFLKIEKFFPSIKAFVVEYIQPCSDDKCCSCDYLKFLQLCLVLLRLLKMALIKEEEKEICAKREPQLLSISQTKTLQKCLQFAVALGILPNLLRGIGIPLSKRLKHAIILEHFTSESTLYQKHIQIAVCVDTLIGCLDCISMQSTILTYHGTDLLAALLQLCHAPIKKIEKDEGTSNEPLPTGKVPFKLKLNSLIDNYVASETQIVNMMQAHRKYFAPHLETFLECICPSLLLWELFLFQGISLRSEKECIAKTPVWLKKICNHIMTDMLLTTHGIIHFVQVIMDKAFDSDIETGKVDADKMNAVAQLITYNPVKHITVADYIEKISKQVFYCLHLNESPSPMDNILKYVAACIIQHSYSRDIMSAEKHFLVKLLKPLWSCVNPPANQQAKVVVKESDLTACINDLHQIFVLSDSPRSEKFTKVIYPYSHCLCTMYFILSKGKSYLRSKVKDLIINIISKYKDSSNKEALSLLHAISFSTNEDCGVYITKVTFVNGGDGGIVAIKKKEEVLADVVFRYRTVLDLLGEIQNKNINRSYILLVLKEFCDFQSKENIMDTENIKAGISFNALLQELSEWNVDIGEALLSNISEVIDILMTLLESICMSINSEGIPGLFDATFYEKTQVVLMILNSILDGGNKLSSSDWSALKLCLPSLQTLAKSDIDTDLKEIISDINSYIATRGVACKNRFDDMKDIMASLPETDGKEVHLAKSAMSNGDETLQVKKRSAKKGMPKHSSRKTKANESKRKESMYDVAMKDVKDDSAPVKAHGLIALKSLLREKDEITMQNKKDLLKIFQDNLENEDEFVYSKAIQGLSLLADIDAELVLPVVLKMFHKGEKVKLVMKLGEVLFKTINSLGEMIHKYKDQLLHVFLVRTKSEDPQIRFTSLSNLGQTCKNLQFNINGHWLQEILDCVLSILKTDPDIQVRRSAGMVIDLLLKGVGKDMIIVFGNEMKTIYTQLKLIYTTETDDILKLHAQHALEEMTSIMKELLCAKLPLTKEIRILK